LLNKYKKRWRGRPSWQWKKRKANDIKEWSLQQSKIFRCKSLRQRNKRLKQQPKRWEQ